MSKIITRNCGKCNKVSTDCFFRKMILNHTIYITDAQSVASKWILRELKNSFDVQECKDDENSEADDA